MGVDIQPSKHRSGKVSRTVSASPLMLDMTVMCTSGVMATPPGESYSGCSASGHRGQYYGCYQYEHAVCCTSGSMDREAGMQAQEFLLLLRNSLSSSPTPTLPRDSAKDSSPPFFARPCSGGTFAGSSGRG